MKKIIILLSLSFAYIHAGEYHVLRFDSAVERPFSMYQILLKHVLYFDIDHSRRATEIQRDVYTLRREAYNRYLRKRELAIKDARTFVGTTAAMREAILFNRSLYLSTSEQCCPSLARSCALDNIDPFFVSGCAFATCGCLLIPELLGNLIEAAVGSSCAPVPCGCLVCQFGSALCGLGGTVWCSHRCKENYIQMLFPLIAMPAVYDESGPQVMCDKDDAFII